MPGKNQSRRLRKSIAHAEMVWEREQLQAATAKEAIDIAFELVKANADDIEADKMVLIEAEVATRNKDIEEFLLKARDKYLAKITELSQNLT
jgi:hypothetical protein